MGEEFCKPSKSKFWTSEQDKALTAAVKKHGEKNWKLVSDQVPERNHTQCSQRWNKVLKEGLVKGHWSPEEDQQLLQEVQEQQQRLLLMQQNNNNKRKTPTHSPTPKWGQIKVKGRTPKQCSERWNNHVNPAISKQEFTKLEDDFIKEKYLEWGNHWTKIAKGLGNRSQDQVKNRWKFLNPNEKSTARPGRPKKIANQADEKFNTFQRKHLSRSSSNSSDNSCNNIKVAQKEEDVKLEAVTAALVESNNLFRSNNTYNRNSQIANNVSIDSLYANHSYSEQHQPQSKLPQHQQHQIQYTDPLKLEPEQAYSYQNVCAPITSANNNHATTTTFVSAAANSHIEPTQQYYHDQDNLFISPPTTTTHIVNQPHPQPHHHQDDSSNRIILAEHQFHPEFSHLSTSPAMDTQIPDQYELNASPPDNYLQPLYDKEIIAEKEPAIGELEHRFTNTLSIGPLSLNSNDLPELSPKTITNIYKTSEHEPVESISNIYNSSVSKSVSSWFSSSFHPDPHFHQSKRKRDIPNSNSPFGSTEDIQDHQMMRSFRVLQ